MNQGDKRVKDSPRRGQAALTGELVSVLPLFYMLTVSCQIAFNCCQMELLRTR